MFNCFAIHRPPCNYGVLAEGLVHADEVRAVGDALHPGTPGALTISGGLVAACLFDASPRVRVGTRLVIEQTDHLCCDCIMVLVDLLEDARLDGRWNVVERWAVGTTVRGLVSPAVRVVDAAVRPLAEPQYQVVARIGFLGTL